MKEEELKLKDCPFCGGEPRLSNSKTTVYCDKCAFGMVIKIWQSRPQPSNLVVPKPKLDKDYFKQGQKAYEEAKRGKG
jgi:hypothetical protein